jgi:hypothetical protein
MPLSTASTETASVAASTAASLQESIAALTAAGVFAPAGELSATEPVDTEPVDTESVDTVAVDTESVDTESVATVAVSNADTKRGLFDDSDSDDDDTESVTELVDTESVDTKAVTERELLGFDFDDSDSDDSDSTPMKIIPEEPKETLKTFAFHFAWAGAVGFFTHVAWVFLTIFCILWRIGSTLIDAYAPEPAAQPVACIHPFGPPLQSAGCQLHINVVNNNGQENKTSSWLMPALCLLVPFVSSQVAPMFGSPGILLCSILTIVTILETGNTQVFVNMDNKRRKTALWILFIVASAVIYYLVQQPTVFDHGSTCKRDSLINQTAYEKKSNAKVEKYKQQLEDLLKTGKTTQSTHNEEMAQKSQLLRSCGEDVKHREVKLDEYKTSITNMINDSVSLNSTWSREVAHQWKLHGEHVQLIADLRSANTTGATENARANRLLDHKRKLIAELERAKSSDTAKLDETMRALENANALITEMKIEMMTPIGDHEYTDSSVPAWTGTLAVFSATMYGKNVIRGQNLLSWLPASQKVWKQGSFAILRTSGKLMFMNVVAAVKKCPNGVAIAATVLICTVVDCRPVNDKIFEESKSAFKRMSAAFFDALASVAFEGSARG